MPTRATEKKSETMRPPVESLSSRIMQTRLLSSEVSVKQIMPEAQEDVVIAAWEQDDPM